jgi:hypothetical protein
VAVDDLVDDAAFAVPSSTTSERIVKPNVLRLEPCGTKEGNAHHYGQHFTGRVNAEDDCAHKKRCPCEPDDDHRSHGDDHEAR